MFESDGSQSARLTGVSSKQIKDVRHVTPVWICSPTAKENSALGRLFLTPLRGAPTPPPLGAGFVCRAAPCGRMRLACPPLVPPTPFHLLGTFGGRHSAARLRRSATRCFFCVADSGRTRRPTGPIFPAGSCFLSGRLEKKAAAGCINYLTRRIV